MRKEKSAGAVVFRKENGIKYLILHYKFKSQYWEFPRGNIEKDETEQQSASREIQEETGLDDVRFIPDFTKKVHWYYKKEGETVFKEVTFFLAETMKKQVVISGEHIGFAWHTYENALNKLTFANAKEVLEYANRFLNKSENI